MGKRGGETTPAKRAAALQQSKGKKARAEPAEGQVHFLEDEDDRLRKQQEADEASEELREETAEEKRLRLAKEYLQHMQAHMEVEEEDEGTRRGVTGGSDDEAEDKLGQRLKRETAEAAGRLQRRIAGSLRLPDFTSAQGECTWTCKRGHRLSATAVALSGDEKRAYSVAKDGTIMMWDLETMRKTRLFRPGEYTKASHQRSSIGDDSEGGADWVRKKARSTSQLALHAVAVSGDGAFLAVGGGDKKVHVFDGHTGAFIQSFPGHRDEVTCLAFREGSHQLFSGSLDRTVKLWSLDDRAYMDTLFGHQAEVLALDVLRAERVVSSGGDRACRVWKIPEESQLLYRYNGGPGSSAAIDTCRYITGIEWLSGSSDGCLQLWTQLKKKPVFVVRNAHGPQASKSGFGVAASAGAVGEPLPQEQQQEQQQQQQAQHSQQQQQQPQKRTTRSSAQPAENGHAGTNQAGQEPHGAGTAAGGDEAAGSSGDEEQPSTQTIIRQGGHATTGGNGVDSGMSGGAGKGKKGKGSLVDTGVVGGVPDVTGWVQSVAVCRGSDLVATGAGDGAIRLWAVEPSKQGGAGSLRFVGGLPARGFVNGLAIAKSGKFLVAAVGQEPRMGRWARDGAARNGLILHRLDTGQSMES